MPSRPRSQVLESKSMVLGPEAKPIAAGPEAKVSRRGGRPRHVASEAMRAGAPRCAGRALPVDVPDRVEHAVGDAAAVVGDLDQIVVGQLLLVVGQVLEAGKGVSQLFLRQQEPKLL
jgi:hypothetical protein